MISIWNYTLIKSLLKKHQDFFCIWFHICKLKSNFEVTQSNFDVTQSNFEVTQSNFEVTQSNFDVTQSNFEVTQSNFEVTQSNFDVTQLILNKVKKLNSQMRLKRRKI